MDSFLMSSTQTGRTPSVPRTVEELEAREQWLLDRIRELETQQGGTAR